MRNSPMLTLFIPVTCLLLLAACNPQHSETKLTILFTSDMHGHIYPEGADLSGGLARLATYVQQARRENPNTLLLDGGDTIQGNPLMYVSARMYPREPNPIIRSMNAVGYDAMAVGNHEFNFGPEYLEAAEQLAEFPFLSANTIGPDGKPAFQPWTVIDVAGVRVGIIGVVTTGIPDWELPEYIEGLSFIPPAEAVQRYLEVLRTDESCDLVVVLCHAGFPRRSPQGDWQKGDRERSALTIARLEGVDVLMTGHIHGLIEPQLIENTWAATAPSYAEGLIRTDIIVRKKPGAEPEITISGSHVPIDESFEMHPGVVNATRDMSAKTDDWLAEQVAVLDRELSGPPDRLTDTAVVDVIHRAQLEATGAQLSIASLLPWDGIRMPAGPVTVKDLFKLYKYENQLLTVRMSGAQIKDFLEWSARYFDNAKVENGTLYVDIDEDIDKYNVDSIEGLTYRIDPTRPEGQRIVDLRYNGEMLAPEMSFTVAVNSYRQAGGGGYSMMREAEIIDRYPDGAREVLIQYVKTHGAAGFVASDNWFVSPDGRKYEEYAVYE